MTGWILVLLGVQALVMAVDEFHFHRRRGLPKWERLGHPLDTSSVLICYGIALALPPSPASLQLYAAAALVSCLLVTKDEFVHARECRPPEHFLHALLFVLHPIVLAAAGWLWFQGQRALLVAQATLTAAFMVYQVTYWNLLRTAK